jgi:hypothetical protein
MITRCQRGEGTRDAEPPPSARSHLRTSDSRLAVHWKPCISTTYSKPNHSAEICMTCCIYCRPDELVVIVMLTITVVVSEKLASFIWHDVLASRNLHIRMLRIDYAVPTRWRHQSGIVDPHATMPVGPSASRLAIQSDTLSHAAPGSSLIRLNPSIAHTKEPRLAQSCSAARTNLVVIVMSTITVVVSE